MGEKAGSPLRPRLVKTDPKATEAKSAEQTDSALRLLQLEADVRRASSLNELIFHLANESRAALEFRQGVVLKRKRGRFQVDAISSVSTIDRNALMLRWIEAVVREEERTSGLDDVAALNLEGKANLVGDDADVYAFPHLLWVPVKTRKGQVIGGLLAARERAWAARHKVIAKRLAETYSHAWSALTGDRSREGLRLSRRILPMVIVAVLMVCAFIPVPITAIAPVETVGRDAAVVSAPTDGVVREVLVEPNQLVTRGEVVALIEDTELRNAAEIAEKSVVVAAARLESLSSGAFASADARRDLAVARAELTLAEAERDLAQERLERVEMRAPTGGLAVFEDARDWVGRPVTVGERLMEIADPQSIEYRIALPVDDLIALREDIPVRIFLDSAPLHARRAALIRASYHAKEQPGGGLAYELIAREAERTYDDQPRIGARGTAQVLGDEAPLAFVLFRRPIAWARQTFGL